MNEVALLREITGCSAISCERALKYKKEHSDCTAIGYLKASYFAVSYKGPFEEKVKACSSKEDIL